MMALRMQLLLTLKRASLVASSFGKRQSARSFCFSARMSVKGASTSTIELQCKRSTLINSDDGEMTTTLCGLGTAGASFPCPRCTWQLNKNLMPTWAFEEFEDLGVMEDTCKDFASWEGELNCVKRHTRIGATLGNNKENAATADTIPKTLKEKAKSAVYEPL
jgi:hypothetical protein